jgi:hypothetical protein
VEKILKEAHGEVRQLEFRIQIWRTLADRSARGGGEEGETASGIAGRITAEVLGGEQNEWFRYPGDVEGEEGEELKKTLARRTRLAIGVLAECGENTVSGWWWLVGYCCGGCFGWLLLLWWRLFWLSLSL